MKTLVLEANELKKAIDLIKLGELVALPTETVYGLAGDAANEAAVQKIFLAKERPMDHPLIVHIASVEQMKDWACDIPPSAFKLAQHFWPGPLTLILPKKAHVSASLTGGLESIALRIPNHPLTLKILKESGTAVAAPSANAHKKTSPTKPEHVLRTLSGKIAAILDGGPAEVGLESTILDLTQSTPQILRPGAITQEEIMNVLHQTVDSPQTHNTKVSGNLKAHYQPEKPLSMHSMDEIKNIAIKDPTISVLHYSPLLDTDLPNFYKMPSSKEAYAQLLYDSLYLLDQSACDRILVETPPQTQAWADVIDRLKKASYSDSSLVT